MVDERKSLDGFKRKPSDYQKDDTSSNFEALSALEYGQLMLREFDKQAERPVILVVDDESGKANQSNYLTQLSRNANQYYEKSIVLKTFNPTQNREQSVISLIHAHQKHRLDVVVLDMNMPGQNGLELLQVLRRSPKTRYLPVIIVTQESYEREAQAVKARQYGAQGTIFAKSATPRLLYDIVMSLESARDQLMDQRWIDLLDEFAQILGDTNDNTVRTVLDKTGALIERTLGVRCLIRTKVAKENVFKLTYCADPDFASELHEVDDTFSSN